MVESEKPNLVTPKPMRAQILISGIELTLGERNTMYGDPIHNLTVAGLIKQILHQNERRMVSPAERDAIDMVVSKLTRAVCCPNPDLDTYIDGAVYFAIAGEAFTRANEEQDNQGQNQGQTA